MPLQMASCLNNYLRSFVCWTKLSWCGLIFLIVYHSKQPARHCNKYVVNWRGYEAHQKDILFVRIIGNALPPLHSANQGILNLLFTLDNEHLPKSVLRVWILNRIINSEVLDNLTSKLDREYDTYFIIKFTAEKYSSLEHDYSFLPPILTNTLTPAIIIRSRGELKTNLSYSFKTKNLYLMNNNGARNFALHLGVRRRIMWIFPWDGNSFVTSETWPEILSRLSVFGERDKYFVSYMARVTKSNDELLQNQQMNAFEEPQIVFR